MPILLNKENAFGLDISDGNLRLMQLGKYGKKVAVELYNDICLPAGCIVEGEIKNQKLFLEYFGRLIKTKMGHGKLSHNVICSLPESKTFLKQISIEACDQSQMPDKIKEVLPQHLPMAIDELYLDSQIIKKGEGKVDFLIGASPKPIVDSYIDALDGAGYTASALEVEAAAISRLIIDHNKGVQPQIVIDIGASRTGLFLYDEDTVKFTVSMPISGTKITAQIASVLDLDADKAEKAKIVCGLDPNKCQGALLEIFSDSMDEICNHISSAIGFYRDNFPGSKNIAKITLCGGGANFSGINGLIQNKLNIATETADPFANIANPNQNYFTASKSQSYVVAMGLALRAIIS